MSREPLPSAYLLWPIILAGIAAMSCASIFIRLADAPPLAIAAYRVTIASMLIGPWVLRKRRIKPVERAWSLGLLILSGVFLALHFVFWITSLGLTTVASAATLVNTTPFFTVLYSILFFREQPGGHLWLGLVLGLAGSVILAGADFSLSQDALAGDLLAVLGALMAAGYLLCGRELRKSLDLPAYTFGVYGAAALVLIALSFLFGTPLSGFSAQTYFFLLMLALVPQLIGHTAFNWALKYLPPGIVSVLILGEPLGAALLAWMVLDEGIPPQKAVGLLVLGAGIAFGSASAARAIDRARREQRISS